KLACGALSRAPPACARAGWGGGGGGEPIEVFGKLQDRFPCARIGQLPSYLPRLLGAVEPLQGFFQHRQHWSSLSSFVSCPFRSQYYVWVTKAASRPQRNPRAKSRPKARPT